MTGERTAYDIPLAAAATGPQAYSGPVSGVVCPSCSARNEGRVRHCATCGINLEHSTATRSHFDQLLGKTFGQYFIEAKLGEGASGAVFLAKDLKTMQPWALRLIAPELCSNKKLMAAYKKGLRRLIGWEQPGILFVREFLELQEQEAVAMAYAAGGSLRKFMASQGRPSIDFTIQALRDMVQGLTAVAHFGLYHGRLKPDNILLVSPGRCRIGDFGSAALFDSGQPLSRAAKAMGHPAYMAPEQWSTPPSFDHRSDLYALGCIVFEMLAGRPPFLGPSVPQSMRQHLEEAPPPLAQWRPDVPDFLRLAVEKMLEKEPEARFQRGQDLLRFLERRPADSARSPATTLSGEIAVPQAAAAQKGPPPTFMPPASVPTAIPSAPLPTVVDAPPPTAMPPAPIPTLVNQGASIPTAMPVAALPTLVGPEKVSAPNRYIEPVTQSPDAWGEIPSVLPGSDPALLALLAPDPQKSARQREAQRRRSGKRVAALIALMALVVAAGAAFVAAILNPSARVVENTWWNPPSEQANAAESEGVRLIFENKIGMRFVLIPPGYQALGSPPTEATRFEDEAIQWVGIKRPFYLGATEVTQGQWNRVMAASPPESVPGDSLPATGMTWYDAIDFCNRISVVEGREPAYALDILARSSSRSIASASVAEIPAANGYRLPAEFEWEYACRAGSIGPYSTGETLSGDQARIKDIAGQPATVGRFAPNRWGLFDMHGNVLEWCAFADAEVDPVRRTQPVRGGSFTSLPTACRSARRSFLTAEAAEVRLGFRILLPLPAAQPASRAAPTPPQRGAPKLSEAQHFEAARRGVEAAPVFQGMDFVFIPAGSFQAPRAPASRVVVTRPLFVKRTEVTLAEWRQVMGGLPPSLPAGAQAGPWPALRVTWFDALAFCARLTEREGLEPAFSLQFPTESSSGAIVAAEFKYFGPARTGYRLPTEAEWEYACRAGSNIAELAGESPFASAKLDALAWYAATASTDGPGAIDASHWLGRPDGLGRAGPMPVGCLEANPFGLSDMMGNAAEWCLDSYGTLDWPEDVFDPCNLTASPERVVRGGSWRGFASECLPGSRAKRRAESGFFDVGFRVLRSAQ